MKITIKDYSSSDGDNEVKVDNLEFEGTLDEWVQIAKDLKV